MGVKLSNVGDSHQEGIKVVGYGQSAMGKTFLINTLPDPIIINIEHKLAPIKNKSIPVINVTNAAEAIDAIRFVSTSDDMRNYKSIAIDSLTELSDLIFADAYKKKNGNSFGAANSETEQLMTQIYKQLKSVVDKNLYMIAKYDEISDSEKIVKFRPRLSTKRLTLDLPHKFDVVVAVRRVKFENEMQYVIQGQEDGMYFASDVFGTLDKWEAPDLGLLFEKLKGGE